METIYLKKLRERVDERFVGFKPNGSSIKPVHIYSGASRMIYGASVITQGIKRLSYVSDAKGKTPKSNTLEKVKEMLYERDALDESIRDDDLVVFRNILQRLLATDNGVFSGTEDSMVSYSAGSKYFITAYALYEDAGEFVGSIINKYCVNLSKHVKMLLDNVDDPISILFEPVADSENKGLVADRLDEIDIFATPSRKFDQFISGVTAASESLLQHLKTHPNQLAQLRIFNFFCIYIIIRYLSLLEAFYCEEIDRPFLLDFSGVASSSVARASVMSYTQIHRSISRFYAWAFAQCLKDDGITKQDLLRMEPPMFDEKGKTKAGKEELLRMWGLAKSDAAELTEDKALLVFGAAIYDMLALEASSHPVVYLRQIGTHAGLLYPPTNLHINKRFVVSQDMLEMIIRACVNPDETLTAAELKHRMWERFGIVVGGDEFDIQRIQEAGGIMSADTDALRDNFLNFANMLEAINFADIMADGILQIRLGGITK